MNEFRINFHQIFQILSPCQINRMAQFQIESNEFLTNSNLTPPYFLSKTFFGYCAKYKKGADIESSFLLLLSNCFRGVLNRCDCCCCEGGILAAFGVCATLLSNHNAQWCTAKAKRAQPPSIACTLETACVVRGGGGGWLAMYG